MTAVAIEIRLLELSDLTAIEEIEQKAFPTPWSRSMFASSSEADSICLGAFDGRARRLRHQLALRRRLARDERRRRSASTSARCRDARCSTALRADARRRAPRLHARGAGLERRAIHCTSSRLRATGIRRGYYTDNREDALIMWRDARPSDPRDRDVLRRDRGGGRYAGRRDRLQRRRLAGRAARALWWGRAGGRLRRTSSSSRR